MKWTEEQKVRGNGAVTMSNSCVDVKKQYYGALNLEKYIFRGVDAQESIILRYHKLFAPKIDYQLLKSISIREGCRITNPLEFKGVNLYFLDMASFMADGNFKSSVACIAIARCIEQGAKGLSVCSSGNTATAIARYSRKAGLPVLIFIPKMSSYKFDFGVVDHNLHKVHIVDGPEWEVHALAKAAAENAGYTFVPSQEHQLESNACRALFVLEYMKDNGVVFNWTSQGISGGHGPVGFYKRLYSLVEDGCIEPEVIPGFIGVQQYGICPMYSAWINGREHLADEDVNLYPENVLEPTLYCSRPENGYRYLDGVIRKNGGAFYAVSRDEYSRYEQLILYMLRRSGFRLKTRIVEDSRVVSEKAGILSAIGMLKAIEDGIIAEGENVLITFTGTTERSAALNRFRVIENSRSDAI